MSHRYFQGDLKLPQATRLEHLGTGRGRCSMFLSSTAAVLGSVLGSVLLSGCGDSSAPVTDAAPEQPAASKKLFSIDTTSRTSDTAANASPKTAAKPSAAQLATQFENVAASQGLDFVYQTGAEGKSLMVETMGGGCGALDYDADGEWDLYFCQGGDPAAPPDDSSQPRDGLYRKRSANGFMDVAKQALPKVDFTYGQGVAIGDYDGDGFDDVYVTNVGPNQLYRNMGDGTFMDVSADSGVVESSWSSSAAFADLTGDGQLDLYVCNYVVYDPRNPIDCRNDKGENRICHPREMEPVADACYINLGDGRFRNEAAQRGLVGEGGKGLGVAIADFSGDGLPDVYVANDTTANFYFVNQGEGKFVESAMLLGCAMNRTGAYQASMGLGIGDFNQDGNLDIYSSHFYDDSNTLYENLGLAGFQDVTAKLGLHQATLEKLGFGAVMEDFNSDGWQEIFVTNGHIENYPDNALHQMTPQLFAYDGNQFVETSSLAGEFFREKYVGRGVCRGDFDQDGDIDIVVVHQDENVGLLENKTRQGGELTQDHSYINFLLRGHDGNRRGIGCKVIVKTTERALVRQVISGGSYASSGQPMLTFGLGSVTQNVGVRVIWPGGGEQEFVGLSPNQTVVIDQKFGIVTAE